jgi:ATP-binding cassette subfamily F protein 3
MVLLKDVSLTFDSQIIFDHISCAVQEDDRIGLVGANGSGKSTLLKIVARQQKVDSGAVQFASSIRIGYMAQDLTLTSTQSIVDEAIAGCMQQEHHEELDHAALKAEAKKILAGLGFAPALFDQPITTLSVGWKMRVLLAQLLLQKADFYLFDEPTNHLDIVAKEWFLDFLKNARFGFILVCHDRYFLDQLCTTIFELERGACTKYRGNYTDYQEQKTHRMEILQASYKNQQRDIARKQRTIDRFRAQASRARMVKKMERDLDKIERVVLPTAVKTVHFSFPPAPSAGKIVLEVHDLEFSFGEKTIFKNVSFTLMRGERMAIIAPNGVGKTTLLNVITGKYAAQHGNIHGGHNVSRAYFEQDQMSVLNPDKTIFETVSDCAQDVLGQELKDLLGCFLFSNDAINKKTRVLSGGEKNRVCMLCALLQRANFLILDEPTNHLDIPSKEILRAALQQYTGTILFVSHDHTFVNDLATSILELSATGAHSYHGTYEQYLDQKRMAQDIRATEQPVQAPQPQKTVSQSIDPKTDRLAQRAAKEELARLERMIKKLEFEIMQLNRKFESLTYGTDDFATATDQLNKTQKKLAEVTKAWELAYEKVNNLS